MCHIKSVKFWKSLLIVTTSLYFKNVVSHVSLTFPPARSYDLDYLDNIRTKPPCGMPRGARGTTLMAGVPVNVSWHLAYPHRGGYRLELLDQNDDFLLDLIKRDKSQTYIEGDPTAQWHTVTIPKDLLCDTCTIRLLRQASEWTNQYRFWSCADVRIVSPSVYSEDCSRHGQVILVGGGDGCKCDRGWWGPRCQYEEECQSNVDCGKGSCVDLGGTALPRKQCFCPPGLHGLRCSLTNNAKLATKSSLDLGSHTKRVLSDKMSLYYKVLTVSQKGDKEIEFVMVVNGTSYGALGWRPASFTKACKLWPYINENNPKRVTRQSSKGKLIYKPNPTLLRPLSDLQRSQTGPENGTWRRQTQIPTLQKPEKSYNYSNKGTQSAPEMEPNAEPEVATDRKRSKELVPAGPEYASKALVTQLGKTQSRTQLKSESKPNQSEPNSELASEPESEPESEPNSEPEVEPNPTPGSKASALLPSKSLLKGPLAPEAESQPELSTDAEHNFNTAPEPQPEKQHDNSFPEPEPEHQNRHDKSSPEPEPEHHHDKNSPEPEPEHHHDKNSPEPEPEHHHDKSSPEPEPEHHHDKSSPEPEPEHHHDKSSPEPEPEHHHDKSSPEPEPEHHNDNISSEPEPEQTLERKPEITPSKVTKGVQQSQYAPKGDFHAMDCTDVVIGAARGVYSRILDYYTRDRSTPRLDEFWTQQGSNSITSAGGWQTKDGTTVLIFRRKIKSSEVTDHDIEGRMHVIWARGQEQGQYVHSPQSGLEKESPSIPNFYAEDEIKYHGHRGQRGSTFIEF